MKTKSMKILLAAAAFCGVACAETAPTLESVDVRPLPHYGRVARKVVGILNRKHILSHPFDDGMSGVSQLKCLGILNDGFGVVTVMGSVGEGGEDVEMRKDAGVFDEW